MGALDAGLVGIVPALGMMTPAQNPPHGAVTFGPGQLLAWSLSLAFFGVFIAVPLRSQTIIKVGGGGGCDPMSHGNSSSVLCLRRVSLVEATYGLLHSPGLL